MMFWYGSGWGWWQGVLSVVFMLAFGAWSPGGPTPSRGAPEGQPRGLAPMTPS